MSKYFINWSRYTGNYLVKRIGDGKILQIFSDKKKAEAFIKKLEEQEYGLTTKGERQYTNSK